MAKVGRFVADPKAGAYCQIGGFQGGSLTIEVVKFMGFSSDRIFACALDSPEG